MKSPEQLAQKLKEANNLIRRLEDKNSLLNDKASDLETRYLRLRKQNNGAKNNAKALKNNNRRLEQKNKEIAVSKELRLGLLIYTFFGNPIKKTISLSSNILRILRSK